jgi:hypothetical protein
MDTIEEKAPNVYDALPEGTTNATTLMSRTVELGLGAAAILKSPLLGEGMGSDLAWDDPARGSIDQAFVDNGWAYVMIKMGGLGVITFGWLVFMILRCMSRQSSAISISLFAILAITMFSEPVCFQYTMSPIVGALAGILYARKSSNEALRKTVSSAAAPAPQTA